MSTITTNGWDVVVAATQQTINNGLNLAYKAGYLPTEFSQTFENPGSIVSINMLITGTFGAPSVTPLSVDSQTVQVTLPITQGTVSSSDGSDPIDISGMQVVVGIYLASIQSELQPEEGTNYDLVIDFGSTGAIQNVTLENVPPGLSPIVVSTMAQALQTWLQTKTANQSYTIATVTLGNFAANAPYLVPTLMEYAFAEDANNDDDNPFAILMLTSGNTDVPQQAIVPDGIIPSGQDFGALISNEILMSDIVVGALAAALGTSASSFTVTGDTPGVSQVVTLNQPVTVAQEGNPTFTALTAQIANNNLELNANVKADFYGLDITYTGITASFTIGVTAASGGSQLIQFASNGYNLPTPDVDLNWFWTTVIDILFGGLTFFLLWLTPLVEKAIEVVIESLIAALLPSGSSQGVDGFDAVLAQVQWNYTEIVNIASVSLPTPMQVVGTLPIVNVGVGLPVPAGAEAQAAAV